MVLRKVTVEVVTKHVVTVLANDADEARGKAEDMVLSGDVIARSIESFIMEVRPVD